MRARITASPRITKARLSPTSGTTSATVAERDEIEPGDQVGRRARGQKPASRKRAVERHQRHIDDAGGAEMAEAGEIVLPVGIDDRDRLGQPLGRLVMVEDDDVEAEPPRFARTVRG